MNLERQRISEAHPDLWRQLPNLPKRLFSGKDVSIKPPPMYNRDGELIPLRRNRRCRGVLLLSHAKR